MNSGPLFQKATRRRAKLRIALAGPSGSGKTYSALLIARGLVGDKGKIAMIDTEQHSGELYDNLTDYDVAPLDAPFSPGRYIQWIKMAEESKYDVLIIDSLSHAWTGEGGVLDLHSAITAAKKAPNSWAAWRMVTPKHNELVNTILQARCHIIATMRTKTAWEVTDDNGKKKPEKVGLAPVQRDGMEYEFTTVLDLSVEKHTASSSKDRTGLFDGTFFVPSIETGISLRKWNESGADLSNSNRQSNLGPPVDPLESRVVDWTGASPEARKERKDELYKAIGFTIGDQMRLVRLNRMDKERQLACIQLMQQITGYKFPNGKQPEKQTVDQRAQSILYLENKAKGLILEFSKMKPEQQACYVVFLEEMQAGFKAQKQPEGNRPPLAMNEPGGDELPA